MRQRLCGEIRGRILQLLRVHLQWSSFFLCGCCIIINIDHLMRTTFTVLLFLLVLQGYVVYLGDADPALHSDSVKANHHNILSSAVGRCSIQVPDL